jgi:hypothetical protein
LEKKEGALIQDEVEEQQEREDIAKSYRKIKCG